ncbi:hypothetical protein TcCL_Unassigned05388 [Trypanosoma cruzi]|nr:hypothetical protein TcCL_Unassigned05388 [Trypanosoma cruzi]
MEFSNAQGEAGSHPRSLPHTYPFPQLFHTQKGKDMEKKCPPHNACRGNAIHFAPQDSAMRTAHTWRQREGQGAYNSTALRCTSPFPDRLELRPTAGSGGLASHTHSEARRTQSALLRVHSAGRRPVTLVPSQWGTKTIVVADYQCL